MNDRHSTTLVAVALTDAMWASGQPSPDSIVSGSRDCRAGAFGNGIDGIHET